MENDNRKRPDGVHPHAWEIYCRPSRRQLQITPRTGKAIAITLIGTGLAMLIPMVPSSIEFIGQFWQMTTQQRGHQP